MNIFGLATGIGVALSIGLWGVLPYSNDRFLPGYQQAYHLRYRININRLYTNNIGNMPAFGPCEKRYPGIKYVAPNRYDGIAWACSWR